MSATEALAVTRGTARLAGERWARLDTAIAAPERVAGLVLLAPGVSGAPAPDLDAWSQLHRVDIPAVVACGDLDVPFLVDRSRALAERLPQGRHVVLAGMAHLPQIENPAAVAAVIGDMLTTG